MVKIIFKGGQWTNKEDRILEAGIAKYGLNNWHRISSLLQRKTADQCKERWIQYLDPTIQKHREWTKEEEEKLIFLQGLFSDRWQTIAKQLPGRTGWMCEEHYAEMLDHLNKPRGHSAAASGTAASGATDGSAGTPQDALQNLRRDLFSQQFETRDAKADTIDDEQQDDMLTVARARLANQYGKKGLRRQRKVQQEEANVLSSLQRAREMQASGTMSHTLKKKIEGALKEDAAGKLPLQTKKRRREEDEDGTGYGEGDDDVEDDDDDNEGDLDASFIGKDVVQNAVAQRRRKKMDFEDSSQLAGSDGLVLKLSDSAEAAEKKQNALRGVISGVDLGKVFSTTSAVPPASTTSLPLGGGSLIDWDSFLPPSSANNDKTAPAGGFDDVSSPTLTRHHHQPTMAEPPHVDRLSSTSPSSVRRGYESPSATATTQRRDPSLPPLAPISTNVVRTEEVEIDDFTAAESLEGVSPDWLAKARAAVEKEATHYATSAISTAEAGHDSLWLSRAKRLASQAFSTLYPNLDLGDVKSIVFSDTIRNGDTVFTSPEVQAQQQRVAASMQAEVESLRQALGVTAVSETVGSSSPSVYVQKQQRLMDAYDRLNEAQSQTKFYKMVQRAEEDEETTQQPQVQSGDHSRSGSVLSRREAKLLKMKRKLEAAQTSLQEELERTRTLLDQGVTVVVGTV